MLYRATAGGYDDRAKADVLLAERLGSIVSHEHGLWTSTQSRQSEMSAAASAAR
jgi:hypothetical protein